MKTNLRTLSVLILFKGESRKARRGQVYKVRIDSVSMYLRTGLRPSLKYIENVCGRCIRLCFRNFTQHKSQFKYERGYQVCNPKMKMNRATWLAFIFGVQTWYPRSYSLLVVLMVRTSLGVIHHVRKKTVCDSLVT